MINSKLDLRKKLNTVTDSEGNVFTAEKAATGYIVNCESQNKKEYLCFANDVKDLFMLFMDNDNQKAIAKLLNKLQAEPVAAEPKKDTTMLSIKETVSLKQILAVKPQFILAVDYDSGSIGEIVGENRDLNKYLAVMTLYRYSTVNNTCLAFYVECLVSVNDNIVTIDEMNTSSDYQAVYARNIDGLIDGYVIIGEYGCIDIEYHDMLQSLIESQPVNDIPSNFILEV